MRQACYIFALALVIELEYLLLTFLAARTVAGTVAVVMLLALPTLIFVVWALDRATAPP
jgi:hypothetical protein